MTFENRDVFHLRVVYLNLDLMPSLHPMFCEFVVEISFGMKKLTPSLGIGGEDFALIFFGAYFIVSILLM